MEMQATSGQFNADLFAMANNTDFELKNFWIPKTINVDINAATDTGSFDTPASIVFANDPDHAPVVEGLTISDTVDTGVCTLASTASGSGYRNTIAVEDGISRVTITYWEEKQTHAIDVSNNKSAIGELIAKWPVYATGDEETVADVKGYVMMKVYKCRVTALPGFDTSYKSAATNQVSFATLDPKNADESVYSIAYIEK